MLSDGLSSSFLFLVFLCPAFMLPLASQLSEEDGKVTKCIMEILVDTLSKPSPIPATSECMKILREDERVLAMLHHQHLLTELEDLTRQENIKHHLGHKGSHSAWEGEEDEQEDVKKRDKKGEASSEKIREQNGESAEEREMKEYETSEKTEEKVKEEKFLEGEVRHKALEEQVKELMEEEKEEKDEEEKEEARKKRRSSSETWSSKEYFGHIKRRGPGHPKIRKAMLQDDGKRSDLVKRRFRLEEEEDSSEEEPKEYHHRGFDEGRHHEDWEDEEEMKKKLSLDKRVAEKASDEETAQFEEEEKGVKVSHSQSLHHQGGWQEEAGETRHGHHHERAGLDLQKRHEADAAFLKGRHHHGQVVEEEEKEASSGEIQKLKQLEEIERELKRAAEKLEELKRG